MQADDTARPRSWVRFTQPVTMLSGHWSVAVQPLNDPLLVALIERGRPLGESLPEKAQHPVATSPLFLT
jgi:hypothetical protein